MSLLYYIFRRRTSIVNLCTKEAIFVNQSEKSNINLHHHHHQKGRGGEGEEKVEEGKS